MAEETFVGNFAEAVEANDGCRRWHYSAVREVKFVDTVDFGVNFVGMGIPAGTFENRQRVKVGDKILSNLEEGNVLGKPAVEKSEG